MGCTNSTSQKQLVAQPASSPPAAPVPASAPTGQSASQPQGEGLSAKAESITSTATFGSGSGGAAAAPAEVSPAAAPAGLRPVAAPKHAGDFRKQRTVMVDQQDLELMVTSYSCHDSTMLASLGKHCKESTWRVQVGLHKEPVEVKVNVDATILCSPSVSITSTCAPADAQQPQASAKLFPQGSAQSAKLRDDFQYTWPFRGSVPGIGEVDRYEVRLPSLVREPGQAEWFPAVVLQQRGDGQLKVRATVPDGKGGVHAMEFPAVKASDMRAAGSHTLLVIPERTLVLQVPAVDPLMAMLSVGGIGQPFTENFARPSPAGGKRQAVSLQVSKKRDLVSADVGFNALSMLHSPKAFSVPSDEAQYQKRSWTVRFGPHASHTVEIERKHRVGADSRVISLTVDGEVLVDAAADDMKIAEAAGMWMCNFRFVAERVFDFEVHESNVDGEAFEQTVVIPQVHKSAHFCTLNIPDERNFFSAQFFVDGKEFHELDPYTEPHEEEALSMPVTAFEQEFKVRVPTAVNPSLPAMSNLFDFGAGAGGLQKEVQVKLLPFGPASKQGCGFFSTWLSACTERPSGDAATQGPQKVDDGSA